MTVSAFPLPEEHIHVLLNAGLRADTNGPLRWAVPGTLEIVGELTYETADQVGQMLVNQNYRSVNVHAGPLDAPAYAYQSPRHVHWSDTEILMAVHCYVYQACDTADWRDTEACAFCEALEGRIIRNLPGYEAAQTWPITADSVPLAAAPVLRLVSPRNTHEKRRKTP